MSYVHLHRHSEFSRLDGIGTAKQYADRAAELGQGALAQTDHGTLSGALHHIDACQKAGIVPISGVEAYFRPIRANKFTKQAWHLCLFAKNLKGWHNLLRIVSKAYGEVEDGGGFFQYPCVDFELLEQFREGLVCSSACISSWLSQLIKGGDSVAVRSYVDTMLNFFGEDFWIEIMPHDFDDQRLLNTELIGIAEERGIKLIATNDAHFPYRDWAETQRMAKIMNAGKSLAKLERDREQGKATYLADVTPTLYLAHEEEMRLWFDKHHPQIPADIADEAIANTELFVQRCAPFLLDKSLKLPRVSDHPDDSEKIIRQWIDEGFSRVLERYPREHWDQWSEDVYRQRIEDEFAVLKSNGVFDYFFLVGNICRYARKNGIRVGLGRGSAAGCLISYLIGITAIDPIPYGLLFERFLNPGRKGLPDIDIDFDSDKRADVKQYMSQELGVDHVADIITHQRFQPKNVIQSLCRAFDVPYLEARAVTDTIEIRQSDEETTLEELLPSNEKLREFMGNYPDIWQIALNLEGTVSNAGKHAAGIIITPKPISEYMALERGKKADLVTSWSDSADFPVISDYGFVKIDALGIKGLTKHEYACQLIKERTGKTIDLYSLPALRDPLLVDDDVMQGFSNGFTIGVFQFSSKGITNLLKEINPESILDISAANALYRPGPMGSGVTWDYAKRKRGDEQIPAWHPLIDSVLAETYGLICYQEEVMEICKRVGGFTGAEADDMRKAMGKLYRIKGGRAAKEFMGKYEEKWFAGCESNNIELSLARSIWDMLLKFGNYGFNKSHSASYALQAYQDMWLKIKYPADFYAAFLTYEDDDDKRKAALREAKALGIEIVMPDLKQSEIGYTVSADGEKLILGLTAIKGVGQRAAEQIIKNRPYVSLDDFLTRVGTSASLGALISAGVLDCYSPRSFLLSTVMKGKMRYIIKFDCGAQRVAQRPPDDLYEFPCRKADHQGCKALTVAEDWPQWQVWEHLRHNVKLKAPRPVPEARVEPSENEILKLESEVLNLPVASLNMTLSQEKILQENVYDSDEIRGLSEGASVICGGEISKVVRKKTKNNRDFANVTLVFDQNDYAVKFWEYELAEYEDILVEGKIIMVSGKKNEWNGMISIVAKEVTDIETLASLVEEKEREDNASKS